MTEHGWRGADMEADVAIVGAGPAGAVTALLCARAGLNTLLLDRALFPRPKPCGDCLSPELAIVLDRLRLLDAVLDADPARLEGWRIVAPDGSAFEGRFREISASPLSQVALSLSRDRLDAALFDNAVRAGARPILGARVTAVMRGPRGRPGVVTGIANREPFAIRARAIVGADGIRSVVARDIGAVRRRHRPLRKISLTAHVTDVQASDDLGEMHVTHGMCAGIAPVNGAAMMQVPNGAGNHDAGLDGPAWNVTLVADADRYGRAIADEPGAFFGSALRAFPALAGRLDAIRPVGLAGRGRDAWLLRSGAFDVPTRRIVQDNVALVGDAAGYYDPFTGQGLYQAVTSAERLAVALSEMLIDGVACRVALGRYARFVRSRARGPRFLQHAIEAIMSRPRAANHAVRWLRQRPGIVRALLAATGDLAPVRSLFTADMLRVALLNLEPHPIA